MFNLKNVDVIQHCVNVNSANHEIIYKYCVEKFFSKVSMYQIRNF